MTRLIGKWWHGLALLARVSRHLPLQEGTSPWYLEADKKTRRGRCEASLGPLFLTTRIPVARPISDAAPFLGSHRTRRAADIRLPRPKGTLAAETKVGDATPLAGVRSDL
jgi:hypothetical protein